MNASQDQGGPKARRMGHPVQVAQSRRKKNAQSRKTRAQQKAVQSSPERVGRVVVTGIERDRIVGRIINMAEKQEEQGSNRFTLKDAANAFLEGLKEDPVTDPKPKEVDNFVNFCKGVKNFFTKR
jgi:hypothetical protein